MKRVALFVSPALGLVVAGVLSHATSRHPAPPVRYTDVATGAIGRALKVIVPAVAAPKAAPDDRDPIEIRRKLREGEAGTYISEILRQRDSAIIRWPDRDGAPLSVWIQPVSRLKDFTPDYVSRVRAAFVDWDKVKLPVRFSFTRDSAAADVHDNWMDHFSEPISGRTRWARDDEWQITDANITLAVHHNQGDVLDTESMRAMALHEIGHLLGLDHTADSSSIMAPRVRVRELSSADRATARLVYALPAGRVK